MIVQYLVYVHVEAKGQHWCRGQRSTLNVFFSCSPLVFSLNLKYTNSATLVLAGHWAPEMCMALPTSLELQTALPDFPIWLLHGSSKHFTKWAISLFPSAYFLGNFLSWNFIAKANLSAYPEVLSACVLHHCTKTHTHACVCMPTNQTFHEITLAFNVYVVKYKHT